MNESMSEIQRLLQEIADHLMSGTKTDTRMAVAKLERIAAPASTLALTIQARRQPYWTVAKLVMHERLRKRHDQMRSDGGHEK